MNDKYTDLIEGLIDWDKFDATHNFSDRINGVTKEVIEVETEIWNKQIELLSPLDYDAIRKEIYQWDFTVPDVDSVSFDVIASLYSRLINYKIRIAFLLSEAKTWEETCESACKYLTELSQGAFPGTGPVKKSNALHVIQPFIHLLSSVSRVSNFLFEINSAISFSASQINSLLIERQSRAKLNHKLAHDYDMENIENDKNNHEIDKNKVIEVDEDGYEFYKISK